MNGRFVIEYQEELKTYRVCSVEAPELAIATFTSMYHAEDWAKRENERLDTLQREQLSTAEGAR